MAKIRTKEAKIQARLHRTASIGATSKPILGEKRNSQIDLPISGGNATKVNQEIDTTMLLGYPIKLLYRDFVRSLAITLILVVLLLGIFLFFRYN